MKTFVSKPLLTRKGRTDRYVSKMFGPGAHIMAYRLGLKRGMYVSGKGFWEISKSKYKKALKLGAEEYKKEEDGTNTESSE